MSSVALSIEDDLQGGPYRHIRPLAEGGMGEVHVVEHRALREQRVMKIVKSVDPAAADELAKRLLAEGRGLRGLRHPNVVEVLDLGLTGSGRPFLVTELLVGKTLRDEADARGPLPWQEVLEIAAGVLAGLDAAHKRGVVHRDLKPLNLFYLDADADGARAVKILDFGIAKAVTDDAQARAGSALVATRAGYFAGSPAYVSPEQASGLRVDARSDLYSLGAVMFYLLTGRAPFLGRSMLEFLTAHLAEQPEAPSSLRSGIPEGLDAVVLRALAKKPEERFASAPAMRAALEALRAGGAHQTPTPTGSRTTELLPRAPASSAVASASRAASFATEELPTEPQAPIARAAAFQRSAADDDTAFAAQAAPTAGSAGSPPAHKPVVPRKTVRMSHVTDEPAYLRGGSDPRGAPLAEVAPLPRSLRRTVVLVCAVFGAIGLVVLLLMR